MEIFKKLTWEDLPFFQLTREQIVAGFMRNRGNPGASAQAGSLQRSKNHTEPKERGEVVGQRGWGGGGAERGRTGK